MMFGPDGIESDTWTESHRNAPTMIVFKDTLLINHRANDNVLHFSYVSGDHIIEIQELHWVRDYVVVNEKLFLLGLERKPTETSGQFKIFVTEGTSPAQLLATIPDAYLHDYGVVGDMLYFNVESGKNLWRTDGTVCGTSIVDVTAGSPYALEGLGNDLIFGGYILSTGHEL